ncbi:MAG: response regulator [Methylococcaceae bacterium]|nr:response regulator [Methylococcaceae bacterium]
MIIKNILVVDDMPIERENISLILNTAGYYVETAASGKDGLKALETYQPDLIFMDIVMPEMDGFNACRQITNNDKTKNIPVVFVSSKGKETDKVWGQLQGAKGHITKPYSSEEILGAISHLNMNTY